MWKTVEIDGNKYVFRCIQKPEGVECILFNFYQSLYEKLNYDDLYLRAKNLNKRLQFDNDAIVETLVNENIYKVQRKSEHVFRFDYRVGCPFIFEWNFTEQTDQAFQKNVVLPLIDVLDCMSAQMLQLSEQLQKKDAEIAQYKLEGAELRRKTVATKPFNVNKFNIKYENIKTICQSLKDISTQVCSSNSMVTILPSETKSSLEQNCNEITPSKLRKRKVALRAQKAKLITNKLHMEQKNKAITYLNSQSQASESTESIIANNVQSVEVAPCIVDTVCLSSDDEIQKINCVEEKVHTSDRKLRVMLPKTLPDSQIIMKPAYRSPRKSLRFTEAENEEIIRDVKKSPKKPKLYENTVELDLDDLFSWKKKSKPDDSKTSIAQLMDALKNLNEQRLSAK